MDRARMAADISRGTWEKVERGEPIKDFSLAAIEEALEWPEGQAQAILDGADVVGEDPPNVMEMLLQMQEEQKALRQEITELRRQRDNTA